MVNSTFFNLFKLANIIETYGNIHLDVVNTTFDHISS